MVVGLRRFAHWLIECIRGIDEHAVGFVIRLVYETTAPNALDHAVDFVTSLFARNWEGLDELIRSERLAWVEAFNQDRRECWIEKCLKSPQVRGGIRSRASGGSRFGGVYK